MLDFLRFLWTGRHRRGPRLVGELLLERIAKKELSGIWRGGELLGAGELRVSPSQAGVADVGMVIAPIAREAGLATQILQQLRHDGQKRGYRLVCSTETTNVPAQKAIARAGFHSKHRILEIGL